MGVLADLALRRREQRLERELVVAPLPGQLL
jgi:hypothetical protein